MLRGCAQYWLNESINQSNKQTVAVVCSFHYMERDKINAQTIIRMNPCSLVPNAMHPYTFFCFCFFFPFCVDIDIILSIFSFVLFFLCTFAIGYLPFMLLRKYIDCYSMHKFMMKRIVMMMIMTSMMMSTMMRA